VGDNLTIVTENEDKGIILAKGMKARLLVTILQEQKKRQKAKSAKTVPRF